MSQKKKDQAKEPAVETEEQEVFTLTKEELEQARAHIEGLEKDKKDMVELLQRNQADFDNYRRRNAQIRLDSIEEGKRECLSALLPILDDFDRMLKSVDCADKAWTDGVTMVHNKLKEALQKQGLSEVDADGKFDPALHNAVMVEKVEDKEGGEVLEVLQKGYKVNERVVRPAMVKVSQ